MSNNDERTGPGLLDRLAQGSVICAEGYLFACERRGYVQAGAFVPEVVLDHPEVVEQLHRDFVHAGSDVVEAFTYYAHREKLRTIGKEHLLQEMNQQALAIAKKVANETNTLLAGDISNTNVVLNDAQSAATVRAMFEEQVGWAVDAGVDYIIAETISYGQEALIALEVIKETGLPAVITLSAHRGDTMREGWPVTETCRKLEAAGADVVGLNCHRGPRTMLPLLREIRAAVAIHVAALPVPYRTTPDEPTFISLHAPAYEGSPDGRAFPTALDPFTCTRYEIADFTREADALGVRYLGVCCGAEAHHIRAMAEALGRTPPASRYTADMSKHAYLGTDPSLPRENLQFAKRL